MGDEVLFLGGRSGVGKSTLAFALHRRLSEGDVMHAVIEGDNLDLAHPAPWKHHLAEKNLAVMWANYRELGYSRLIYTNTVSVLEVATLSEAIGSVPRVIPILMRAGDETILDRLGKREQGASLVEHVARSSAAAVRLDAEAGESVHVLETDGRTVDELVEEVMRLLGWN